MKQLAKVVWNWRAVPQQIIRDYRFHRRMNDDATSLRGRFGEQLRLLWSNRITAQDYYKFGLFDQAMPDAVKRGYIGEFQPWKILSPVNTSAYHSLTDNKLQFHTLATAAELPVAETLATIAIAEPDSRLPNLTSESELSEWLLDNAVANVFLKPLEGLMGRGTLSLGELIEGEARWHSLPGGEAIDVREIWAHCVRQRRHGGMIVQHRLRPHERLAQVMPNVLHTVRVITYLEPEPTIIDAVLRIGSGRAAADNMHAGGLVAPIDLASGQLGQATMVVDGLPQLVDHHPLTAQRISGVVLPNWDEVLALARKAARVFDMQRSLGWDIGLSDRGPILVEGNWRYDVGLMQVGRRRGVLDTPWVKVFNREGAYRNLGLGFFNRPRA